MSYNILDLVNLLCLRYQKCLSQKLIRWSLNFTLQLVVSLFNTYINSWPWPCLWLYIVSTPRWELVGCWSYKAYLLVLADTNHSPGTAASSHNIRLRNACLSIVKSILHSYNKEDDKLEPWYVCCCLLFISCEKFMSYLFSIMNSFSLLFNICKRCAWYHPSFICGLIGFSYAIVHFYLQDLGDVNSDTGIWLDNAIHAAAPAQVHGCVGDRTSYVSAEFSRSPRKV